MKLLSLFYVSRSTGNAVASEAAMADIVETAHRNNPTRGLTGALIFTGSNFAQILEGPTDAVEEMMTSITTDFRHHEILIADRTIIAKRRFPGWSMAYFGSVQYVERHIAALLEEQTVAERRRSAKMLSNLIHQFSLE
jgi:hypothetical protein